MKKGKVIIAGAGPGDMGLVTLKTFEYIKKAEVIVYDRLVSEDILTYADKNAEMIYMGKDNDGGGILQDRINDTIYTKAAEGKLVLRLKGGDPFLFGRGGEEAEYLADRDIDFEIIPGVTSAIAVPAYAGIPVTHRDFASELHIFTAHKKNNEGLNYEYISKLKGTLVFLMGAGSISEISEKLIKNGVSSDMPVAMLENGTTNKQKVVTATLSEISAKAAENNIKPPSVIIVGETVKMAEKIGWFKSNKRKIIVTSDKSIIDEVIPKFGSEAVAMPMIKTEAKEFTLPIFSEIDLIFFTGVKGVRYFFSKIEDLRILGNIKIGAVGEKTAEELKKYKINPDVIPVKYTVSDGIDETVKRMEKCRKIVVVTSDISPVNCDELMKKYDGVNFTKLEVYTTQKIKYTEEEMKSIADTTENIIIFMSSSAVDSFAENGGIEIVKEFGIKTASIGPVTSETMIKYGIKPTIEAEIYTAEGIVEALNINIIQ